MIPPSYDSSCSEVCFESPLSTLSLGATTGSDDAGGVRAENSVSFTFPWRSAGLWQAYRYGRCQTIDDRIRPGLEVRNLHGHHTFHMHATGVLEVKRR